MKTTRFFSWGIAALAAVSFAVSGCKKSSDDPEPKKGGGEPKPAPAEGGGGDEPTPEPAPAPEPEPAPEPAPALGGNVSDKLEGHWGIDGAKMVAMMKEQAEKEGASLDDPITQGMIKMMEEMADKVVLHFTDDGKVIAHTPDGEETATFTVGAADAATGEFELTVKPDNEDEPKTGKGKIDGDTMTMEVDGEPMAMVRLSAADAAARKKAIAELQEASAGGDDPVPAPVEPVPVPDPAVIDPAPAPVPDPPVIDPAPAPAPTPEP